MDNLNLSNIINELRLDRNVDDLKDMTGKKLFTIPFTINNIEYKTVFIEYKINDDDTCITIYFIDDMEWRKLNPNDFSTNDDYKNMVQKLKMGKTGNGSEFKIFNKVYNIIGKFIEKFKPKYIGFEAYEENRKSLYEKMNIKLQKELIGVKYKKIDINPLTNKIITDKEFYFEKI